MQLHPTVRPAVPDDADEVVRLAGLMYESMGVVESASEWRLAGAGAVRGRLGVDLALFVADDPSTPGRLVAGGAGTVAHRLPGPGNVAAMCGYIQWISTEPAWRRHGLARTITGALLDWYERVGVGTVELHATADGEGIYRALGFTEARHPALRRRRLP